MAPSFIEQDEFDHVSEAIRLFYQGNVRLLNRMMARHGVSIARTKLLLFVEREGPVRSADVVEAFGYSPRTVTEAIDALEREGLAVREPDAHDRRAKRISITRAGRDALKLSEPVRRAFLKEVFDGLDADESATFRLLLGKLNARLALLEQTFPSPGNDAQQQPD